MKEVTGAVFVSLAILASALILSLKLSPPVQTYDFKNIVFKSVGMNLTVEDPDLTQVEVHRDYVVLISPEGLKTIIPMHLIHAIEVE